MNLTKMFRPVADVVSRWAGRPVTFIVCVALVVIWGLSGPVFKFSDTWQLVINTSTTIVTFLMVFLIQNTQNRDNLALQAKLDELIRVGKSDNKFIGVEHLTDEELEALIRECEERVATRKEAGKAHHASAKQATKRKAGGGDKAAKAREAARKRAANKPAKVTVKRT